MCGFRPTIFKMHTCSTDTTCISRIERSNDTSQSVLSPWPSWFSKMGSKNACSLPESSFRSTRLPAHDQFNIWSIIHFVILARVKDHHNPSRPVAHRLEKIMLFSKRHRHEVTRYTEPNATFVSRKMQLIWGMSVFWNLPWTAVLTNRLGQSITRDDTNKLFKNWTQPFVFRLTK